MNNCEEYDFIDSFSNHSDIIPDYNSDIEYLDNDTNNNTNNDTNNSNKSDNSIIIDMDIDNTQYSNKILGKLIPKSTFDKKPNDKLNNAPDDTPNNTSSGKHKLVITKKINATSKDSKDSKDNNLETKESKDDAKFEFNDKTIDFYSRDLDFKKICVKKSAFKNDTALLCLLFKMRIFTEYRCNIKKCKIGKTWLGKPIQLLITRKNSKIEDLTVANLELICPNCFIGLYGLDIFQKSIDQTIYKCKLCTFPLNKFSNTKKKEGYCSACESKIINSTYYTKQNEYIDELKHTIDEDSTLKPDEFTSSNYYNEVSQYKPFKDNKDKCNPKSTKIDDKPIIKLNMNITDLSELIKEDIENDIADDIDK